MSSDNDIVLSVKNISKCFEMYEKPVHRLYQTLCAGHKRFYKEFWALKDISFEVRRGECVGIIGRNGAGKSTLLQIITGTLAPSSGEVKISGRVAALLELGSGFNPEFTGRENVYLNASILGLSRQEIEAKLQDILDFADIGEFIDQPVKSYSSGMAVRLAFATMTAVVPEIIIVDEALSVGDIFFQQKCIDFIKKELCKCTKFLVSHDLALLQSFANRVIVLDAGQIVFSGKPVDAIKVYTKMLHKSLYKNSGGENVARDTDSPMPQFSPIASKSLSGAGGIIITGFLLRNCSEDCLVVSEGDSVAVQIQLRVSRSIARPVIGYFLRDRTGGQVMGSNTDVSRINVPKIKFGICVVSFSFTIPNIRAGEYLLTLGVGEGTTNNQIVCCWAQNIAKITVDNIKSEHSMLTTNIDNFNIEIQ